MTFEKVLVFLIALGGWALAAYMLYQAGRQNPRRPPNPERTIRITHATAELHPPFTLVLGTSAQAERVLVYRLDGETAYYRPMTRWDEIRYRYR